MVQAYLGLGSNIGNRHKQLMQAIDILDHFDGIKVTQVSQYTETAPVGYTEQPQFLNLCVEINTQLTPRELLNCCLETEKQLSVSERSTLGSTHIRC